MNIVNILKEINIPFAYHHFAEGEAVDPPFICYSLPNTNHFSADGIAYLKINRVVIEVYTDRKNLKIEKQVEKVMDAHLINYRKSEVWIEQEKLYEVSYTFEMEE